MEIPDIQVRAELRLEKAKNKTNKTQYFILEVIDEKFVDISVPRIKTPMRPSWRLPEQESFCVDLSYCSIDFFIHRSQIFPAHFSGEDQTAVLVYISCPGLVEDIVADYIFKILHLRRNQSPDLGQLVDGPELVVVEALIDMTGLVGDITTEPVLNTRQRPRERPL